MQKVDSELLRKIELELSRFPVFVHPFEQMPMEVHTHSFVELVYVRAGQGLHRHGNHFYPVRKGDCFTILPGEPHGYKEGKGLEIVNVLFAVAAIEPHLAALNQISGFREFFSMEPLFRGETAFRYKLHCPGELQKQIEFSIAHMLEEQTRGFEGHQLLISTTFLHLVVTIGRSFSEKFASHSIRSEMNAKEHAVDRSIAFLQDYFDSDISIKDIASAACLSPGRLSHLFKEKTGLTLLDYLLQTRLDYSRKLLLESENLSVSMVAFEAGFHDPAYFARVFGKAFGLSPLQYRKKAEKSTKKSILVQKSVSCREYLQGIPNTRSSV